MSYNVQNEYAYLLFRKYAKVSPRAGAQMEFKFTKTIVNHKLFALFCARAPKAKAHVHLYLFLRKWRVVITATDIATTEILNSLQLIVNKYLRS